MGFMKMKSLSVLIIVFTLGSCTFFKNQYVEMGNREKFFNVSMDSPNFAAGETEAQFDSPIPLAPLRKADINIVYFPFEDAVCLEYRIDMTYFYQFWDREGRDTFIKALADYNTAFDDKKLNSKNSGKTRNLYGIAIGYLIWRSGAYTRQMSNNMFIELGYYFRNKAPFFTITQGNTFYEDLQHSDERQHMVSVERPLFLTRAQAAEIANCFDQTYLLSLIPESLRNAAQNQQRPAIPVDYESY